MKLASYAPAGNEILLELKEYTEGTIKLIKPEHDKVMKVLKVGPMVTLQNPFTGKRVEPGDYVIMVTPNLLQFTFDGETAEAPSIQAVQGKEFGVAAFYLPGKDEKKYWPTIPDSGVQHEPSRDLNIIDNPGIDKSPYLKEEAENKQFLDATT